MRHVHFICFIRSFWAKIFERFFHIRIDDSPSQKIGFRQWAIAIDDGETDYDSRPEMICTVLNSEYNFFAFSISMLLALMTRQELFTDKDEEEMRDPEDVCFDMALMEEFLSHTSNSVVLTFALATRDVMLKYTLHGHAIRTYKSVKQFLTVFIFYVFFS